MPAVRTSDHSVSVWGGKLDMTVRIGGQGPPLVYLHAAGGLMWDPFLDQLAEQFTIHAPFVPGTAPGKPDDIGKIDDLWDLVLVYDELLAQLDVRGAPMIGQSFGGMLACELAAHDPAICSKLVVLAPVGLWLDEHPVTNWVATAPQDFPALLFHRPDCDAAVAMFTPPDNPDAAIAGIVATVWATGCTSKFLWPVPDKGLSKRIHRITAPTLIVWGQQDALISSVYAAEFGRLIAGSRVEVIDACGHIPQMEQLPQTLSLVREFLA